MNTKEIPEKLEAKLKAGNPSSVYFVTITNWVTLNTESAREHQPGSYEVMIIEDRHLNSGLVSREIFLHCTAEELKNIESDSAVSYIFEQLANQKFTL